MPVAAQLMAHAKRCIVVGTSLQVYPAAGLLQSLPYGVPVHVIDPAVVPVQRAGVEFIQDPASQGMVQLVERLLGKA